MMSDEIRPPFQSDMTAQEFLRWYWSKRDLEDICVTLKLSQSGSKNGLRKRVAERLAGKKATNASKSRQHRPSINWSKATLDRDTIITSDISFGPNVRGFFRSQIGPSFVCHGEFMAWVKANAGATLGDAVEVWQALEERKRNPDFRREIASHNNYLQYLRDFQDAFPDRTLAEAKRCWDEKKVRPARDGFVVFDVEDIRFVSG
ncbi:MAG: DUF6434 domain-containing protein [Pseudomonadota bacterium]